MEFKLWLAVILIHFCRDLFHCLEYFFPFFITYQSVDRRVEDVFFLLIMQFEDIQHHLLVIIAFRVAGVDFLMNSFQVLPYLTMLRPHNVCRTVGRKPGTTFEKRKEYFLLPYDVAL